MVGRRYRGMAARNLANSCNGSDFLGRRRQIDARPVYLGGRLPLSAHVHLAVLIAETRICPSQVDRNHESPIWP